MERFPTRTLHIEISPCSTTPVADAISPIHLPRAPDLSPENTPATDTKAQLTSPASVKSTSFQSLTEAEPPGTWKLGKNLTRGTKKPAPRPDASWFKSQSAVPYTSLASEVANVENPRRGLAPGSPVSTVQTPLKLRSMSYGEGPLPPHSLAGAITKHLLPDCGDSAVAGSGGGQWLGSQTTRSLADNCQSPEGTKSTASQAVSLFPAVPGTAKKLLSPRTPGRSTTSLAIDVDDDRHALRSPEKSSPGKLSMSPSLRRPAEDERSMDRELDRVAALNWDRGKVDGDMLLLENWLNEVLAERAAWQRTRAGTIPEEGQHTALPPSTTGPQASCHVLHTYGLSRPDLLSGGLQLADIHRLYRHLYVHTLGCHDQIKDALTRVKQRVPLLVALWRVFLTVAEHLLTVGHQSEILSLADDRAGLLQESRTLRAQLKQAYEALAQGAVKLRAFQDQSNADAEERSGLLAKLEDLQPALEASRAACEIAKAALSAEKTKLAAALAQVEEEQQRRKEMSQERSAAVRARQRAEAEVEAAARRRAGVETEISDLREMLDAATSRKDGMQWQLKVAVERADEARAMAVQAEKVMAKHVAESQRLETEVRDRELAMADMRRDLLGLTEENVRLKAEGEAAGKNSAMLQQEQEDTTQRLDAVSSQLQATQRSLRDAQAELVTMKGDAGRRQAVHEAVVAEHEKLSGNLEALAAQHQQLEKSLAEREWLHKCAQHEMERKRESVGAVAVAVAVLYSELSKAVTSRKLMRRELVAMGEEIPALMERERAAFRQLAKSREEVARVIREGEARAKGAQQAQALAQQLNQALESERSARNAAESRADEAERTLDAASSERAAVAERLEAAVVVQKQAEQELSALRLTMRQVEADNKEKGAELDELRREVRDLRSSLVRNDSECEAQLQTICRLQREVQAVRQAEEALRMKLLSAETSARGQLEQIDELAAQKKLEEDRRVEAEREREAVRARWEAQKEAVEVLSEEICAANEREELERQRAETAEELNGEETQKVEAMVAALEEKGRELERTMVAKDAVAERMEQEAETSRQEAEQVAKEMQALREALATETARREETERSLASMKTIRVVLQEEVGAIRLREEQMKGTLGKVQVERDQLALQVAVLEAAASVAEEREKATLHKALAEKDREVNEIKARHLVEMGLKAMGRQDLGAGTA